MSSSEKPKWWPISCTSTWVTMASRLSSLWPNRPGSAGGRARSCWASARITLRAERQPDALEQAEQVVAAAEPHVRRALQRSGSRRPGSPGPRTGRGNPPAAGHRLRPPGPRIRPATGPGAGRGSPAGRTGGAWGSFRGPLAPTKQLTTKPKWATLTIINHSRSVLVSVMSRIRSLFGLLALIGALGRLFGPRLGGILRLQRSARPGPLQLHRHAGRLCPPPAPTYSAPRYSSQHSRYYAAPRGIAGMRPITAIRVIGMAASGC